MTYEIGQANNALIYPGLGLGVIASGAKLLTDRMISVAAIPLAALSIRQTGCSRPSADGPNWTVFLKPWRPLWRPEAKKEGLNRNEVNDPDACIKAYKWEPQYK